MREHFLHGIIRLISIHGAGGTLHRRGMTIDERSPRRFVTVRRTGEKIHPGCLHSRHRHRLLDAADTVGVTPLTWEWPHTFPIAHKPPHLACLCVIELPPLQAGYIRIAVALRRGEAYTPGDIARAAGIPVEHISHIVLSPDQAYIDVRPEFGRQARDHLAELGRTELIERHWQWLKLGLGRNHGISMGQLRRIMQTADALPLGRIIISNTHTMIGLQDHKMPTVLQRLSSLKINGFAARPAALPQGVGPGPAEYVPNRK
jgi:hypothetical protein